MGPRALTPPSPARPTCKNCPHPILCAANTSPARQHGGWDESKKDLAKSSNSALRPRASCGGPPGADSRQTGPLNWTKGELIGQGAFGSVFLGMDNDTGQLMAVKQVHVSKAGSSKVSEHVTALEAEVRLLQQLDHPNIVRYLSTETTNDALHIFLEFVPGGSIASLLAKFGEGGGGGGWRACF